MSTESEYGGEAKDVFRLLENYPWQSDKEFQGGLSAILGPNPSTNPSQITDLTLRAQCFYMSRKKNIPIDFNAYKEYLASKPRTARVQLESPPQANTKTTTTISTPLDKDANTNYPSTDTLTPPNPPPSTQQTTPPHPANFQEIIALIQSGAPIPGIMDIPDTVLTGQCSTPTLPRRKKPWEKELPSTTEGTFGDRRDVYIAQELPEEEGEELLPASKLQEALDGAEHSKEVQ